MLCCRAGSERASGSPRPSSPKKQQKQEGKEEEGAEKDTNSFRTSIEMSVEEDFKKVIDNQSFSVEALEDLQLTFFVTIF